MTIGKRTLTTLRVFDVSWETGEDGVLVEAYLTAEGRTALFRRYNGKNWRPGSGWQEGTQNNQRLFLDGAEFIHWYDCLSSYIL